MRISFIIPEPVRDLADLGRRMRRLAALGYQGVELLATHPLGYAIDDLVNVSRECRLPVVSLLSGWSYFNEKLSLVSPDADVRGRAVDRLGEYAWYASRLGAVLVVGQMQGFRTDEPDEARAQERIADCLRQAGAAAAGQNVRIVVEPVNHLQVGFNHTAAEVAGLVERVGSPAVGYMLDTIHMNIEERSLLETVRQYGAGAGHFHLCETNGGPFGTGGLDFPRVLGALRDSGYAGIVSIKIYQRLGWEEAARSAMEYLERYQLLA